MVDAFFLPSSTRSSLQESPMASPNQKESLLHQDYGLTVISLNISSSAPRLSVTVSTTRNTSESV